MTILASLCDQLNWLNCAICSRKHNKQGSSAYNGAHQMLNYRYAIKMCFRYIIIVYTQRHWKISFSFFFAKYDSGAKFPPHLRARGNRGKRGARFGKAVVWWMRRHIELTRCDIAVPPVRSIPLLSLPSHPPNIWLCSASLTFSLSLSLFTHTFSPSLPRRMCAKRRNPNNKQEKRTMKMSEFRFCFRKQSLWVGLLVLR